MPRYPNPQVLANWNRLGVPTQGGRLTCPSCAEIECDDDCPLWAERAAVDAWRFQDDTGEWHPSSDLLRAEEPDA